VLSCLVAETDVEILQGNLALLTKRFGCVFESLVIELEKSRADINSDHPALELSIERFLVIKHTEQEEPGAGNEVPRHVALKHDDDREAERIEIKQADSERADPYEQPLDDRSRHLTFPRRPKCPRKDRRPVAGPMISVSSGTTATYIQQFGAL